MGMESSALVEQILTLEGDALERLLEAELALGEPRPLLLYQLRNRSYDVDAAWRTTFATARLDPSAVAVSMHTYGRALNLSSGWEASIWPLRIARAAYGWAGNHDGAGRAGATLADSLYVCGKYDEAMAAALAAEAIFLRAGKLFETGKCRITIASVYADRLDPLNARRTYEAATASLLAADVTLPHVVIALAETYIGMGSMLEKLLDDFEAAGAAYAQAEAALARIRDQIAWPQVQATYFRLFINRAIALLRLGRHTDARRALDQAQQALPEDDLLNKVEVLLYRGYQLWLLGDTAKASQRLDQAIGQARQLAQEQPRFRQRIEEQQVRAAMFAGYRPDLSADAALALLDEAADLCARLGIQVWPAIIATEQVRVAYGADRRDDARRHLERAYQHLSALEPPPRRRFLELEVLRALYEQDTSLDDLERLAATLRAAGDDPTCAEVLTELGRRAEQETTDERAYRAYIAALDVLDHARGALRLSPQSIRFLARWRHPYERAFALAARRDPTAAFVIGERARAQALLDQIANQGLHALLDRDDARLAQLRRLRLALERAYARTAVFRPSQYRAVAADETAEQRDERAQAEAAYAEELLSLQALGSDEAAWIRGEIASVASIQQMLAADTAIVAYVLVDEPARGRRELWATVLTAQGAPIVRRIAFHHELRSFFEQWGAYAPGQPGATPLITQGLLSQLHRLFFGPLADLIAAHHQLIFIPDEELPLLPLHAARDPAGEHLVERHIVSYAPSASVLLRCHQREHGRRGQGTLLLGWAEAPGHPLPHIRDELRELAPLLKTSPCHGPLAVAEALAAMAPAQIIHIACHGSFPPDSPLFAHLLVGHQPLYAHDLYGQRLCADLLTLSACDVGQHGPGLQGLVGAGLVAGASSVLASMWLAHDRATARLMQHVYHALIDARAGRAEALCLAQRALLRDPALADPALWAPFFLTGVPAPLP